MIGHLVPSSSQSVIQSIIPSFSQSISQSTVSQSISQSVNHTVIQLFSRQSINHKQLVSQQVSKQVGVFMVLGDSG